VNEYRHRQTNIGFQVQYNISTMKLANANDCRKDYDANKLLSGVLQLSAQTHLVLDETCLEPGQLDSKGVHNVAALGTLISQQKVDYDFQFYKLEFQTNIPVLVLSEGKSLLPVGFIGLEN